MTHIQLSNNRVALIDAVDAEKLSTFKWSFHGRYARTSFRDTGGTRHIYMHRMILEPPSHMFVDHINGDCLDNRRANLRIVTRAQNGMNRRAGISSQSGVKGVHFSESSKKWSAEIWDGPRKIYIGMFESLELAEAAYLGASIVLQGEFSEARSRDEAKRQEEAFA